MESASSATCLLGRRLTLACLQIKEYRAKVPPTMAIWKQILSYHFKITSNLVVPVVLLTFAIVISSENHKDVFEKRNNSKSPEDKWKNTVDFFISIWMLDIFSKSASVNVERRDAQIAIDDSKALIGQYKNRFPWILLKETQNSSRFNNWVFLECTKNEEVEAEWINWTQTFEVSQHFPCSRSITSLSKSPS